MPPRCRWTSSTSDSTSRTSSSSASVWITARSTAIFPSWARLPRTSTRTERGQPGGNGVHRHDDEPQATVPGPSALDHADRAGRLDRRLLDAEHAGLAHRHLRRDRPPRAGQGLSLIHISEPTRLGMISYAVFCLKKKEKTKINNLKHEYQLNK